MGKSDNMSASESTTSNAAGQQAPVLDLDVHLSHGPDQFDLIVNKRLPMGGVTALFGPSGGGKTTLLRVIAGFQRAQGQVEFDGELWADEKIWVPAHQRQVGFMFQDARLFSHLTVAGNLAYADQRSAANGVLKCERNDVVEAFALTDLLDRQVSELSGGERQRVGLARTVLSRPRIMLLDEPLAALDHAHKAEILPYLETLIRRFHIPTLYVSHDVDEVARFANQMLVLEAGRVRAFGETADLLQRLDLLSVTGRFEASSLLKGIVVHWDRDYQLVHIALSGAADAQQLVVPWTQARPPSIGEWLALRIRTRDVAIALGDAPPRGLSIRNHLRATLVELQSSPDSPFVEVLLQVDAQPLRARITRAAVAELRLELDQAVYGLIKSVTFETVV